MLAELEISFKLYNTYLKIMQVKSQVKAMIAELRACMEAVLLEVNLNPYNEL